MGPFDWDRREWEDWDGRGDASGRRTANFYWFIRVKGLGTQGRGVRTQLLESGIEESGRIGLQLAA